MSRSLCGKRRCSLEYSGSIQASGSQTVFGGRQEFRWGLLGCSVMNVGIESASSTKALIMKADSFIINLVEMVLMSSRRAENNYRTIFRYIYYSQVW